MRSYTRPKIICHDMPESLMNPITPTFLLQLADDAAIAVFNDHNSLRGFDSLSHSFKNIFEYSKKKYLYVNFDKTCMLYSHFKKSCFDSVTHRRVSRCYASERQQNSISRFAIRSM